LESGIQFLLVNYDSLENTITALEVHISDLEDDITVCENNNTLLIEQLGIKDGIIDNLSNQITSLNSIIDSLEDDNSYLLIFIAELTDSIGTLNDQLLACNENPALVPIEIDLLQGWNTIGFTLAEPQDIVASFEEIDQYIQIVKNNQGQTYWPEFGFNGIGDLIPGQGYQLRLTTGVMDFSFSPVDFRIELTPSVPQWAIDMEVPVHPNDIRTLVRIINLFGQEVNPDKVSKGEVLLYMYNDGTIEKILK
jgi:prefoldin subunit 5